MDKAWVLGSVGLVRGGRGWFQVRLCLLGELEGKEQGSGVFQSFLQLVCGGC